VLAEALRRNLYGTVQPRPEAVTAMVHYLRHQVEALAQQPIKNFFENDIKFAPISL
jgi:hypothetical protein